MKNSFSLGVLCIFSLMLIVSACSGAAQGDTPIRVGTLGTVSGSLECTYTLDEAVDASDLVLDVTISKWLGEDLSDNMTTFFNAEVNSVLKGDAPSNITLLQVGNSEWTHKDFPLFQKGDQLIVFLRKAGGNTFEINFELDYDNSYWLTGAHTTVLHVQTFGSVSYALDRFGMLTEAFVNESEGTLASDSLMVINDSSVEQRFWKQMNKSDPLISQSGNRMNTLVVYDKLIGEIERFEREDGVFR